jgi:hypothetical protein
MLGQHEQKKARKWEQLLGREQKQEENGGGGEIRTHDRVLTYAGFQDRCIQPLCHPSEEREFLPQQRMQSNFFFRNLAP